MMIKYSLDILHINYVYSVRNLNLKLGGCNENSFKVAGW